MAIQSKTLTVLRSAAVKRAQPRSAKNLTARLLLASALGGLVLVSAAPNSADAQFVCGRSGDADADGAMAGGAGTNQNVACGTSANATGTNGRNTALGNGADASGGTTGSGQLGSWNTAIGNGADATSPNGAGRNTAVGVDSSATGTGFNTALGIQATASGDNSRNFAQGFLSEAEGNGGDNIAIGTRADAIGANTANTAIGSDAKATGGESSAFGSDAEATHANASAFGTGAKTTRDNQQMFGTGTSTYTMAGIAAPESATAQGTPTRLVSSNDTGDLAAHTFEDLGIVTDADLTDLENQVGSNTSATEQNASDITEVHAKANDNMTSIQKNTTDIKSNTEGIDSNSDRIDTNKDGIETNKAGIRSNSDRIDTNTAGIRSNSARIDANTARIDSNTARIGGLENRVDRNERQIDENTEGVALAMAMEMPFLNPGKTFGLVGHWGNYDGSNAFAMGGLYRAGGDFFVSGGVGVGLDEGKVGGRAGLMKQW